ncbi:hypothetical protein SAMN06265218_11425 [Fodinibius sediminis]|uniref:Uncharacterized protein n=1 Tax=Fodinibius sediminis TaxID=1214077 RepID=A0A521E9L4_9BACT|nr:hypothetical protein SAMN06265218_11425 [Fodinibius sediminis]
MGWVNKCSTISKAYEKIQFQRITRDEYETTFKISADGMHFLSAVPGPRYLYR